METINGYTVIADRKHPIREDERVILAVVDAPTQVSGFEYVVATTRPREERPTAWNRGDYTSSLTDAVERYQER